MKSKAVLGGLLVAAWAAQAKTYEADWASLNTRPCPQWWRDAKFGVFIHWGLFSVPAFAPTGSKGLYDGYAEYYGNPQRWKASKAFPAHHAKHHPNKSYSDFAADFTAAHFRPDRWADLIRRSGARYVVLTAKFHDGFALWPSAYSPYFNAATMGAGRDICGELSEAVRAAGLRMGFYYSLLEWRHPRYNRADIGRFVAEVVLPQMKELVTAYRPEIVWTDGEWDYPWQTWRGPEFLAWLYNESPVKETVVANDRWGKGMRGDFRRCIFRDAVARVGGGLRNASVCSSVFFGGTGTIIAFDTSVRQSTISSTNGVAVLGSETTRFALAFQATGCTKDQNLKNGDLCRGLCYSFDNGKSVTDDAEGVSTRAGDLRFVDFAHDDLRLRSDSPLVMDPIALDADYWKAPVTDVAGVPFSYKGGKTVAGGILTPVPVLIVETPAFGSATSVGTNVVEVGDTLTVDFIGSTKRRLEALLVNGEPVEGTSYTFAPGSGLAADGSPIPSATLSYLFSTNWYVNAATGADSNDGFTAETPWKTLAQIANSGLMLPGDCVHAAAGDYAEGTVAGLAEGVGNCRVLLPTGVTLVADEGAEKTRIVGAADVSVSDSYGRGPNAVRCAYLQAGARLVGFTLTGGRVPNVDGGDIAGTPSCVGGGLYSEELASAYSASATGGAFDCVFTDCVAGRGGAAFGTRLVNCTIRDCVGTACSPVAYKSVLYGCAVDDITRGTLTLFRVCYVVSHCTVGANVREGDFFAVLNDPKTIENNVLLAKLKLADESKKLVYDNCLLTMDEEAFASLDAANRPTSVRIASAAEAGYSDAGRPLSAKALGVDKATGAAFVAATDAAGLPRVSNGTMDLGAFEFDWRPIYAQDLGSVGTVVRADAPVVEKDGQVFLPQGELELVLADDAQCGRYRFPVQVTGTGTLAIRAGDETLATFDAADGAVVFRYRTRTAGTSLTFAYTLGEGDTGGARLAQASGGAGLLFVVR